MTTFDLLVAIILIGVLVLGAVYGLVALVRALFGYPVGSVPSEPDHGEENRENVEALWGIRKSQRSPSLRMTALNSYEEIEQIHRQARIAMNSAAGEGWRNILE